MRDKLLDLSDKEDIDLAVDNMTGKEFAISLNKWSQKKGKYQCDIPIVMFRSDITNSLK